MPLDLLDRWSSQGLLSESPAEDAMTRILENGPGSHARAAFAKADGWRQALKAVASDSRAVPCNKLVIFPQAPVLQYRTDFLVVTANVSAVQKRSSLRLFGFFVEVDGRIGHVETDEQIASDITREAAIRRETGMCVLRFSGAECMYTPGQVSSVIGAQVEALAALRDVGWHVHEEAEAVLRAVARLSKHRSLRTDFTERNSERSRLESYDPADPFGEWGFSRDVLYAAACDDLLALRVELVRLYHAVARARQAAPDTDEYEPAGDLVPFQVAFCTAIETVERNFLNPS